MNKSLDQLKNEYLSNIKYARNNYIDDLPPQLLKPWDANYDLYKCRGNFMVGIGTHISRLLSKALLNTEDTIKDSKNFMQYIQTRNWKVLTTKEEIDMVNNVLDSIIRDLENK